ncbi:MAG: efflux RND transporter periplasmic adaptor subunit [Sandaracinaceae bacterium]
MHAEAEANLRIARAVLGQARSGARNEDVEAAAAEVRAAHAALDGARQLRERLEAAGSAVAPLELDAARSVEGEREARAEALSARLARTRVGGRPADVTEARARVFAAEAALRRIEAQRAVREVRAPFGGTVIRVDLDVGERVGPEYPDRFVDVADLSFVDARVDVAEQRIGSVSVGAPARVVVDAVGSQALPARVHRIEPFADRSSNTVEVLVRLDEAGPSLRPGLSARATILASRAEPNEREEQP